MSIKNRKVHVAPPEAQKPGHKKDISFSKPERKKLSKNTAFANDA